MCIKRTQPLIFYWDLSTNVCWKKCYDMTKVWGHSKRVTQEREEGRLIKNVTKSEVGEGYAAKKCDFTHSKKRDFASDVLF